MVGGSGLYVTTGCLGQRVESNTASYDLTIGLPQVDTTPDPPFPPEIRQRLDMPDVPKWDLVPPIWTAGPRNSAERQEEEHMTDPVWGAPSWTTDAPRLFIPSPRETALWSSVAALPRY